MRAAASSYQASTSGTPCSSAACAPSGRHSFGPAPAAHVIHHRSRGIGSSSIQLSAQPDAGTLFRSGVQGHALPSLRHGDSVRLRAMGSATADTSLELTEENVERVLDEVRHATVYSMRWLPPPLRFVALRSGEQGRSTSRDTYAEPMSSARQ